MGFVALVANLAATYAETFRGTGSSYLLRQLDKIGFVSHPSPSAGATKSVPSLFSLTDETALMGLLYYGTYLGAIAIGLAVWAESKKASTLYMAAGFIVGAAAMTCFNFSIGMLCAGVGAAALFWIRKTNRS